MDTGYVVKSQSDGWMQGKGANQTGGYKEKEPIGNQTGGYKENEPIRQVDTKKRSQSDGWQYCISVDFSLFCLLYLFTLNYLKKS